MIRWLLNSGYFPHPWFLQYNVTEQYNHNNKALASGRERPKQKTNKTQRYGCMTVGKSFSLYLLCSPLPYNGVRDTNLIGYGEDPKKSNT